MSMVFHSQILINQYIREIVNHIDILNVDWVISYHSDIDKEKAQEMLESLKIPSSKYKFTFKY